MSADDFILGDPLTQAQDKHDKLLIEYKKALDLIEKSYTQMVLAKYKSYPECDEYVEWQEKANEILKSR